MVHRYDLVGPKLGAGAGDRRKAPAPPSLSLVYTHGLCIAQMGKAATQAPFMSGQPVSKALIWTSSEGLMRHEPGQNFEAVRCRD